MRGLRAGYAPDDAQVCLRVPGPGVAVGRHGSGSRRAFARRRGGVHRGRFRPAGADQPAGLGRTGRRSRPDRERAAGTPRDLNRLSRRRPRALGRSGHGDPAAVVRGRSLDGPVLRARRGGCHLARRRLAARPRAGAPHAGLGFGAGWGDGRDHRPRRRPSPRARRCGRRARDVRRRQPQRPGPSRRFRRARGDRRRGGDREGAGSAEGDRAARLGRRALPAHGRGGRGDARRPRDDRLRRPDDAAFGQQGRHASSRSRRLVGRSSSTT